MEKEFDKALSAKFRTLVEEKEPEPYELGAWENFQVEAFGYKGNKFKFLWIGIAASFLMAMTVTSINNTVNSSTNSNIQFAYTPSKILESIERVDLIEGKGIISDGTILNEDLNILNKPYLSFNNDLSPFISSTPISSHRIKINTTPNSIETFIPSKKQNLNSTNLFKVGMMLSSSVSHSKSNLNGRAIGAGLIAEIPLAKNLSLNTGLNVSSQKIKYTSFDPSNNSFVTTKGNLVNVDLPVNLKYNLLKKKKKELFVSAGISSLAYLKDDFNDYTEGGAIVSNENKSDKSFGGFDFARLLNFSFGVEIPLENQLSLLIEPYVKAPIGDLTSRDLLYTSAGLNLRLNMGLAKLY